MIMRDDDDADQRGEPDEPQDDAGLKWPRDSAEEDFEAARATQLDAYARWAREQRRIKPLTDALEQNGIHRGDPAGEPWTGQPILPDWWDEIAKPGAGCAWCQRPGVPMPCPECRDARAAADDPPSLWSWWASLTPELRRLNIAARFSRDPWSDRRVRVGIDWADAGGVSRQRYAGCTPNGIYWQARREV